VYVYGGATLTAPRPTIGGIPFKKLKARILKSLNDKYIKKGYLLADGILSRIKGKKKSGKIVVWITEKIGTRGKLIYVAQKGELFSHGDTVKQAIHDLRYKLSPESMDTTKYQGWTLESVHPIADIIGAFRAITGACETGIRMWCEGKDLPEKLSVKKAIELTAGQYKSKEFAGFFKGGE
jgi:hypothetical protein